MKINSIKLFYKNLSKITKIIIVVSLPFILSMVLGSIFMQIYILLNGETDITVMLLNDLLKCSGDSLLSLVIPLFFIEIYSRYS